MTISDYVFVCSAAPIDSPPPLLGMLPLETLSW